MITVIGVQHLQQFALYTSWCTNQGHRLTLLGGSSQLNGNANDALTLMSGDQLKSIYPASFGNLQAETFGNIKPERFANVTKDQIASMDASQCAILSIDQMSSVPATVFAGYTGLVYLKCESIFSKATMKQINQLAGTAVATALLQLGVNILTYCGGIDGPDAAIRDLDMDLISRMEFHEIMKFKSLAAKGNAECGSSELSSAKIADIDSASWVRVACADQSVTLDLLRGSRIKSVHPSSLYGLQPSYGCRFFNAMHKPIAWNAAGLD